ncbi:MAG: hypothetical protein V1659_02230 [Candidatus Woesearchaeota archaeon]
MKVVRRLAQTASQVRDGFFDGFLEKGFASSGTRPYATAHALGKRAYRSNIPRHLIVYATQNYLHSYRPAAFREG